MMRSHRLSASTLAIFSGFLGLMAPAKALTSASGVDPETGFAAAVTVVDKALAHTTQLLPVDSEGKVGEAAFEGQLALVIQHLAAVLEEVGSGLPHVARLNVYVASDELVAGATSRLKQHLGADSHPAVTFAVTPFPDPKILVAVDAIAAVGDDRAPESVLRYASPNVFTRGGVAHVAVLPKGRTLYISGMAEQAQDLVVATVGTMKQLHQVLTLNKIGPDAVVHLKTFMKPASETETTERVMAAYYSDGPAPPMSFVEWRNGLPIEIELIAHLPGEGDSADPVQLLWPEGETRSPVYCRFAVVNSAARIYTKGYLAEEALDADGQIRDIFRQMEATLTPLGSDFRHLVKATYLHSADDTGNALNTIRPEFYDPERPPAASKATIAGTGDEKRTMVVDMIAVPK